MTKQEKYETLLKQLRALAEGEGDRVSLMANFSAAMHETMQFFWVGFYVVKGDELRLGPFQGSVACMHIGKGKGVCGTAWQRAETIVVEDVEQFPGHIACSSLSRSEIVVPMKKQDGTVWGVLDIDSTRLADFDDIDRHYLEAAVKILPSL